MTSEEYKAAANFWRTKKRKEMSVEELKQGYDSRQVLEYLSGGQDADI